MASFHGKAPGCGGDQACLRRHPLKMRVVSQEMRQSRQTRRRNPLKVDSDLKSAKSVLRSEGDLTRQRSWKAIAVCWSARNRAAAMVRMGNSIPIEPPMGSGFPIGNNMMLLIM
jgi:hypothetical protein